MQHTAISSTAGRNLLGRDGLQPGWAGTRKGKRRFHLNWEGSYWGLSNHCSPLGNAGASLQRPEKRKAKITEKAILRLLKNHTWSLERKDPYK